jgi:hypothetical protein
MGTWMQFYVFIDKNWSKLSPSACMHASQWYKLAPPTWTSCLGWPLLSVTATRMQVIRSSWSCTSVAWMFSVMHLDRKISSGFRSGEHRGQMIGFHGHSMSTKWLLNQLCIWHEKWGGWLWCWNRMLLRTLRVISSNKRGSILSWESAYWIPPRWFIIM